MKDKRFGQSRVKPSCRPWALDTNVLPVEVANVSLLQVTGYGHFT